MTNHNKTTTNRTSTQLLPQSSDGIRITTFVRCQLQPQHLLSYKQMFNAVFQSYDEEDDPSHQMVMGKCDQISEEIRKESNSLGLVSKKVAVVHGFIHNAARKQVKKSHIFCLLETHLECIVQQDLANLVQPPKKRQNSISKIYNYIRDMTASKDKRGREQSCSKAQNKSTGSVQEVISKVFKPYIGFLRKIITSYKVYSSLVNGDYRQEQTPIYWKVANWSHILGEILKEIIRLARYIKEDFEGIEVLLVYLISIDLAMFYDILQAEIESRGTTLMQTKAPSKISEREYIEVKELIEESWLLKESLNVIFCTANLKEWRKMFARSQYYKYEQTRGPNQNEQLFNYIQKKQKQQKKSTIKRGQSFKETVSTSDTNDPPQPSVKQQIEQKIQQLSKNPFVLHKSISQHIQTKNHPQTQQYELEQNKLSSYLQTKNKVIPQHSKPFEFCHDEDSSIQLNILAKNSKIDASRKMRLMHFNDRQKPSDIIRRKK